MNFKSPLKSLTLAVLLLSGAAAQADITIYTTRASFLAALASSGTDTFNDLTPVETSTPLLRSAGAYAYRASVGPVSDFYPAGTAPDIWLSTAVSNDTMTFDNFTAGIRGFGGNFFGSNINGLFDPNRTIVLTASDGVSMRTVNLMNTSTSTFLGFISSDPLRTVSLHGDGVPGVTYWATANDVTIGLVPEPAAYAMLAGGLGLVGFALRRRNRA